LRKPVFQHAHAGAWLRAFIYNSKRSFKPAEIRGSLNGGAGASPCESRNRRGGSMGLLSLVYLLLRGQDLVRRRSVDVADKTSHDKIGIKFFPSVPLQLEPLPARLQK
jgi:hypothetical protein